MILHAYPHPVVATITESLGPVERGAIYADPINEALTNARIGTVTGGGSQLSIIGTVAFIDIEVSLANLDEALDRFRELLRQLGAPEGSVLTFSRDGIPSTISVATGEPTSSPAGGHAAFTRRLIEESEDEGAVADDSAFAPEYDPDVVRQTAERVLQSYRSLMVDAYAYGPITRSAYDAAHFVWYDERTAEFRAVGFDALDDLKIVQDASKPEPGAGPFARRFVSRDHQHRADIFQVQGPDGSYVRVMNLITELSDGTFVWSCTAAQRWDTPPHLAIVYLAADIAVDALLAAHATRVTAQLHDRPGVNVVPVTTLQDSLESEARCQRRTAEFRRQQQVPSTDELVRLGSEPHLAAQVHAELLDLVAPAPADRTPDSAPTSDLGGEWSVTTIDIPTPAGGAMPFDALIQFALDQGITQVQQAGSPLNPFLVYDSGRAHFFVCLSGDGDPLEIALHTLAADTVQPDACALVIDSRLTLKDGKKDAIVVMASQRGAGDGVTWGQTYRPKGFLRSFKALPFREQIATSRNFFTEISAAHA